MLRKEIRIIGEGGQGVILLGRVIGEAAVIEGKKACQVPYYGTEARGALCISDVIISEESIEFPFLERPNCIIAMSRVSEEEVLAYIQQGALVLVDSDTIRCNLNHERLYRIPATNLALKIGSRKYANMVMLGAFVKLTNIVSPAAVKGAIEKCVSKRLAEDNHRAFLKGFSIV